MSNRDARDLVEGLRAAILEPPAPAKTKPRTAKPGELAEKLRAAHEAGDLDEATERLNRTLAELRASATVEGVTESINRAADAALRAIEAGDLDGYATAIERLMILHAIGFGDMTAEEAVRAKQKTAARNPRSKPKQQARELWDSMEPKPNNWVGFHNALDRHGIECGERQARDWYSTFR